MTLRPPAVDIFERKPCVRTRRVLWGWYVRFIGKTLDSSGRGKKAQDHLQVNRKRDLARDHLVPTHKPSALAVASTPCGLGSITVIGWCSLVAHDEREKKLPLRQIADVADIHAERTGIAVPTCPSSAWICRGDAETSWITLTIADHDRVRTNPRIRRQARKKTRAPERRNIEASLLWLR